MERRTPCLFVGHEHCEQCADDLLLEGRRTPCCLCRPWTLWAVYWWSTVGRRTPSGCWLPSASGFSQTTTTPRNCFTSKIFQKNFKICEFILKIYKNVLNEYFQSLPINLLPRCKIIVFPFRWLQQHKGIVSFNILIFRSPTWNEKSTSFFPIKYLEKSLY